MTRTMRRTNRQATPARWQAALGRALAEGVQVRQLAGSGAWVATSGTDAATAYGLDVTGRVAHGCDCPAGASGDPVCKHRAAPAVPLLPRCCPPCDGKGYRVKPSALFGTRYRADCLACGGLGAAGGEASAPLAA